MDGYRHRTHIYTHVSRPDKVCFQARITSHLINLNVRNSAKNVLNHSNGGGTDKLGQMLSQCTHLMPPLASILANGELSVITHPVAASAFQVERSDFATPEIVSSETPNVASMSGAQ